MKKYRTNLRFSKISFLTLCVRGISFASVTCSAGYRESEQKSDFVGLRSSLAPSASHEHKFSHPSPTPQAIGKLNKNPTSSDCVHRLRRAQAMSTSSRIRHLLQQKSRPKRAAFLLEQVTGIEPAYSAWEADTLPLSYTCTAIISESSSIIIQNAPIVKMMGAFFQDIFALFFLFFRRISPFFGSEITKIRVCNSLKTY